MFAGKNVLVTGGSRGIGRAIVEEFAARGANVALTYNASLKAAQQLVNDLTGRYPEQAFLTCHYDAGDGSARSTLADSVVGELGSIDVLINNAGITRDTLLVTMGEDQWQEVIEVNLSGVFRLSRAVVFQMIKQRAGSIVNISSVAGLYGNAGQANYSAAKAGIIGFTKALAKEVVARGIRVNAVAPGLIETDMTAAMSDVTKQRLIDRIGVGRLGTVAEVAKAVVFLASSEAGYITAQVLAVDGGLVI